jgi:hypothetical protein
VARDRTAVLAEIVRFHRAGRGQGALSWAEVFETPRRDADLGGGISKAVEDATGNDSSPWQAKFSTIDPLACTNLKKVLDAAFQIEVRRNEAGFHYSQDVPPAGQVSKLETAIVVGHAGSTTLR